MEGTSGSVSRGVGRTAFVRPVVSLFLAMAGAVLCGLVIHMATGGTDTTVDHRWAGASLLAGALAVALGVIGIEDGARGRAAFLASAALVIGIVVAYALVGPVWVNGL